MTRRNIQRPGGGRLRWTTLLGGLVLALGCAASGWAQTRLVTLGTQGGPLPSTTRAQPANALLVGDKVYLIDAGDGVIRQLYAAGIDIRRLGQIFITHDHDDHNAGWGALIGLQWDLGIGPVQVYGPSAVSMMQGFRQYFGASARIREADSRSDRLPLEQAFQAHDIRGNGLVFQDGLIRVTAQENCHYQAAPDARKARHAQDRSYALRIATPDKTVVFSGDTGRCPALTAFARDADLLVHEVIDLSLTRDMLRRQKMPDAMAESLMRHMADEHTVPEDIGRLAQAAGVKKVVLTHVVPGGDEPDARYTDGVRKHFKGPVVVARDLMVFGAVAGASQ